MDSRALIFSIALRKSADLKIRYSDGTDRPTDVLSRVSLTQLPSLPSPDFMEYWTLPRIFDCLDRVGGFHTKATLFRRSFSKNSLCYLSTAFENSTSNTAYHSLVPMELHLPYFPSLEMLVINTSAHGSIISTVLWDFASSSLKTLTFLGCLISEGFMAELTQFVSDRENNTSTSLNRVVIIDQPNWYLPAVPSIERLTEQIPVAEVMEGMELLKDPS